MRRWRCWLWGAVGLFAGCGGGGRGAPVEAGPHEDGAPSVDAGPATPEERLRAESRTATELRVVRGTIRSLRGTFPTEPGESPEAAARGFVSRHRSLFGLEDADAELSLRDVRDDGERGAPVSIFDRLHRDVPVFGAEIRVAFEPDGTIGYVGARVPATVDVEATPTLTAEAAAAVLVDALASVELPATPAAVPVLGVRDPDVLLDTPGTATLAWRVSATIADGTEVGAFVGAADGALLQVDLESRAARERQVLECNAGYLGLLRCAQRDSCALVEEAGPITAPACTPSPGAPDRAAAVYAWAGQYHAYLLATFGRDSWDGRGATMRIYIGRSDLVSSWERSASAVFLHPAFETLDFVAHELTHGLLQVEAELAGYAQPGAIGESIGDVFASFVDGDWQILRAGGDVERDLAQGPARRRATHYPEGFLPPPAGCDADCLAVNRNEDFGHVHFNSSIPSLALYLLTVGGVNPGRLGSPAVRGIGQAKVEQILYRAIRLDLLPTSTFEDLRWQLLRACTELRGRFAITTEDCGSVLDAFAAVGIGAWDHDADTWGDDCTGVTGSDCVVVDNCPTVPNPDQADSDSDRVGDACEGSGGPDAGAGSDSGGDVGMPVPSAICPPVFTTGSNGVWPLAREDGPRDERTAGLYARATTCTYAGRAGADPRTDAVSAWWNEASGAVVGAGCFASATTAGGNVCSDSRQATAIALGNGDGFEDEAELRLAADLLARVEPLALACPTSVGAGSCAVTPIACPGTIDSGAGPTPLSPESSPCPVASTTMPSGQQASCSYEVSTCGNAAVAARTNPPGTPTAPAFWLTWAELPGQSLVGTLRGACTDGAPYFLAGMTVYPSVTHQAQVTVSLDDGTVPALASRARELLGQLESRALPCP